MNLDSGRLVAINATVFDARHLDHPEHVEDFMRALAARIKMKPLSEPTSIFVPPSPANVSSEHADDGGLTTQMVISTSHIAYHSWPLQRRFRLVVDSCRDYDPADVIAEAGNWFALNEFSCQNVAYEPPGVRNAKEKSPQAEQTASP
jgi:S-adenosylmethionine/arginine decarboxylase-like enzyme